MDRAPGRVNVDAKRRCIEVESAFWTGPLTSRAAAPEQLLTQLRGAAPRWHRSVCAFDEICA